MTGPPLWDEMAPVVQRALELVFGKDPDRASVSFLGVEPIDVLRYPQGETVVYVSLGMARRHMTGAEESLVATTGPRAELLVEVRGGDVWRSLAMLAAAPAVEGVVYVSGMTVDTGAGLVPGSRCTGAVVAESGVAPIETGHGLPVEVLRLLPATAEELAWCRVKGSAALRALWDEQGVDPADLSRPGARLS